MIPHQAGLKRTAANTGAVTLIQRFGSAANLNIHLHCLVLDGVYRNSTAVFHEVAAPTLGRFVGQQSRRSGYKAIAVRTAMFRCCSLSSPRGQESSLAETAECDSIHHWNQRQ
jgi:hypothetical protein